jgi:hypothetical protein
LRDPRSAKALWSLSFSDVVKSPETVRVECFQPPIAFTMAGDRLTVAFDFSYGPGQPLAVIDPRLGKPIGMHRLGGTSQLAMPTVGRTEVAEASYFLPGIEFVDLATGLKRSVVVDKDENWNTVEHGVRTAFSPDGDYLLVWNKGGVAVLRHPVSGKFIRKFKVNQREVEASAFSPDGLWLATGGANGLVALWDVSTGEQVWAQGGHPEMVNRISFASRRRLVSSSRDLTAMVWDLRPDEPLKKQPWESLNGDNSRLAYMAVWALADDPAGPALLRSKIRPAPSTSVAQIQQWIADIGSPRYATRESATAAIRDLGRLVEPELRALRAKTTDEEVRTRIDGLLDKLSPTRTAIEVVHARAVAAMEIAGTADAKKLLAEWASGGTGSRLTIDAKAALGRMSR